MSCAGKEMDGYFLTCRVPVVVRRGVERRQQQVRASRERLQLRRKHQQRVVGGAAAGDVTKGAARCCGCRGAGRS